MSTAKKTTGGDGLPVVTVARFEAASRLIEQLVEENTDTFVGKMHAYRERQRAGSSRPLTAAEAAQVAAGLATELAAEERVKVAEDVQASGLRAVDEPSSQEVLLAAGLSTAPAFLDAALRFVALIELPADEFETAYDAGELDAALAPRIKDLRQLPLEDARERASAALDHLGTKAGVASGEGVRLLIQAMWQALQQAANQMAPTISGPSSLTDSHEPTDGPSETSSTTSPLGEPSPISA
jgi:hypothetical protein